MDYRNSAELPGENAALTGLTSEQVEKQRELFGRNTGLKSKNPLLENIRSVVLEPMFILLLAACCVYFFMREFAEAFTMLAALSFVAGIDVFQNFRSQKAVKELSHLTENKAKVIRNSETVEIAVEEVVIGDVIVCEEGTVVPADAEIISSNDFSVNEALLTGESVSVEKFRSDSIMQGTLVVRGYCYALTKSIGTQTVLSGIGHMVATAGKEKTPLQRKVQSFIKVMVIVGSIAFAFVWGYHWWESGSLLHGLLHGLTMAMSVLPEEIPVALSSFMALGAYRLLKHGVIARSPQTVETLGSATVICLDKTGTLTQNLMNVVSTFFVSTGEETDYKAGGAPTEVLEYAMWASEVSPFDPMEKSIHHQYAQWFEEDQRANYHMVKEFPLSGTPPVMTHVFQNDRGKMIIGCKGALEGVLKLCNLDEKKTDLTFEKSREYAAQGLRVLAVAKGNWTETEYPQQQEDIPFEFLGLIAFYDPPKPEIAEVIAKFYEAGVDVKMVTGDYPETALAIARQTGILSDKVITGTEMGALNDEDWTQAVKSTHIFARIAPELKLKIINELKQNGEVVAMTGDGVNDAPALKSAHIGIAMGKRGTEVAKGASGLILSHDDLSKMVDAIYLGRRINENLTKAIRYIISIHIPIILLVTIPIFLTGLPAMLFSPVHVIFFELIMGPTCSIIYENEPMPLKELQKPVPVNLSLLRSSQVLITVLQGLMITVGCTAAGYFAIYSGFDEPMVRSYIFTTLIFSNILLTLINRSFRHTIVQTLKRKNYLIPLIISISLALLFVILYVPAVSQIFEVAPLRPFDFLITILSAALFTFWFEVVKVLRKPKETSAVESMAY